MTTAEATAQTWLELLRSGLLGLADTLDLLRFRGYDNNNNGDQPHETFGHPTTTQKTWVLCIKLSDNGQNHVSLAIILSETAQLEPTY